MTFNDIIGQQAVKQHLLQMVHDDRLPHALMLCGQPGVGKLPLALAFARYLLCPEALAEAPCEQCADCQMSKQWAHPDLHFSFPVYKRKSTDQPISDDYLSEWRTQLQENVYFDVEQWLSDIKAENQQIVHYVSESDSLQKKLALKSSQGGRRVVVMWLPERMQPQMANKLLKLIEEPPTQTHFLLVSNDPEMVLGTIQSRVQRINVPAPSEAEIAEALVQRQGVEYEKAKALAHVAQGSYTMALKRLDAENEEAMFFELFKSLMRHSYARKIKEMHAWAQEVAGMGRERQKRLLAYCQRLIRENFIYNFHQPEMSFLTLDEEAFSTRFAPFVNEKNIIGIMDELSDAQRDIEQNVNARMVFFDLSLKMIMLLKQ